MLRRVSLFVRSSYDIYLSGLVESVSLSINDLVLFYGGVDTLSMFLFLVF